MRLTVKHISDMILYHHERVQRPAAENTRAELSRLIRFQVLFFFFPCLLLLFPVLFWCVMLRLSTPPWHITPVPCYPLVLSCVDIVCLLSVFCAGLSLSHPPVASIPASLLVIVFSSIWPHFWSWLCACAGSLCLCLFCWQAVNSG